MFDPVDPRQSFPELEEGILQYWKEYDVFRRSVRQRPEENAYSFYDGPPFITGNPHYGTLLSSILKDVVPRYQTMRGKRVERRWGWDCHGLPIEQKVQAKLGLESNDDIEKVGVNRFIEECYNYTQETSADWEWYIDKIGRWVDFHGSYKTQDSNYMESVMWVFSQMHQKGLIYKGKRVSWYSWKLSTPISNFEIAMDDSYESVSETAVTIAFPITTDGEYKDAKLLAWTTTPWTLPMHMAIAVNKDVTYALVQHKESKYLVAEARVDHVFKEMEVEVVKTLKGKELVNLSYQPPFNCYVDKVDTDKNHKVYHAEFVSDQDGTGIAHEAPEFGDVDFQLAQENGIHITEALDRAGLYTSQVPDYEGRLYSDCIDDICERLKNEGTLFKKESITHRIPFCPRSGTPLIQKAQSSWFVDIKSMKPKLFEQNEEIYWFPEHFKHGRFQKSIESAPDWSISRTRYWGTPMPVWENQTTGEHVVISSRDELMKLVPDRFTKISVVRHGESENNLKHVLEATLPGSGLTDTGKKQASDRAEDLKQDAVAIQAIYSSPFARTKQTAEIINQQLNVTIKFDERIREIDANEHDGTPYERTPEIMREKFKTRRPESFLWKPGMETWEEMQTRIEQFLEETLPNHKGQHIVLSSHAIPLKILEHMFTGKDAYSSSLRSVSNCQKDIYYWDHERNQPFDLHKDVLDTLTWTNEKGEVYKRIPEVLDCWIESASMPWAQDHYPFENKQLQERKFPADFIVEYTGQIRAWFYVMHVLAVALNDSPSFKNVVVTGVVNGTDGRKMSKSYGNYPDPKTTIEKYGADALRFYMLSTPLVKGGDTSFSEQGIDEALKRILLPFWNTYSFFVTYANAADFTPVDNRNPSDHPLDKWITSEMQDLVNRMTNQFEKYDLSGTCSELDDTIDALTNWYVRLSRKRFAGKEGDQERDEALNTLYNVLLTMCQMLAPICPFISESMYLNLTESDGASVHLTDWPATKELSAIENKELEKTRLLRLAVSLGMSLRGEHKMKIRQPLSSATIAISNESVTLDDKDLALLRNELNVKNIHLLTDSGDLAEVFVQVDARQVGKRLGAKVQQIIKAGKAGNFTQNDDGTVSIEDEIFSAEEAAIVYRGKEGKPVAADRGVVVHLDLELTEDLQREGEARDIIRSIQSTRKDRGLHFTDVIELQITGADNVLNDQKELILNETNAVWEENSGEQYELELGEQSIVVQFKKRE